MFELYICVGAAKWGEVLTVFFLCLTTALLAVGKIIVVQHSEFFTVFFFTAQFVYIV